MEGLESIQELQSSIGRVREHSDNVWVLGDFNLPKLNWSDGSPESKPDCSLSKVYDTFLNTIEDYNFTQVVSEPTRQENILDLFLTTNPTLISNIHCSPGLGDHDIVCAEASLKPTQQKQKPRKVLLLNKADWPTLKAKLKHFQQSFLANHLGKTVDELWTDCTNTLDKLSEECHTKSISKISWDLLTMTTHVTAKNLFSFLKNSRRDQQGTPPLKHDGILHSETKTKANLFNQQFKSVLPLKNHYHFLASPRCVCRT